MESPTSTFTLLDKARTGDRESLSALFEKYQRRLGVLIYYKLKAKAFPFSEVEDILQETYLRAFRDLDGLPTSRPAAFCAGSPPSPTTPSSIACAITRASGAPAKRFHSARPATRSGPGPADTKNSSRLFGQQQDVERLLARLDALPEDYRQAILCQGGRAVHRRDGRTPRQEPRGGRSAGLPGGEAIPRAVRGGGSMMDEEREKQQSDRLAALAEAFGHLACGQPFHLGQQDGLAVIFRQRVQARQQPLHVLLLAEQAAGSFGVSGLGAERVAGRAEWNLFTGAPLARVIAQAINDGVVGDGGEPAQKAAGRLVGEPVQIAKGAQVALP